MSMRVKGLRRERGVVLFIALVLLLVLTIAGISSVQTTSLEERMARNTHDSVLAFQAAESALREAEQYIRNNVSDPLQLIQFYDPGNNLGMWLPAPYGEPDRWLDSDIWEDGQAQSRQASAALALVAAQPRYIIEWVATIDPKPYQLEGSYNAVSDRVEIFRITARGVGGTQNASVLLQSTFGKRF